MSDSKKTITIEIKDRWTNRVLYAAEIDPDVAECWRTREAVEQAVKVGAWLDGANLTGANLDGANLAGARLAGARLVGAWLDGARLVGAWLAGANLVGANLTGANLDGANLAGANLVGANLVGANLVGDLKLVGDRPILQLGPLGSRSGYLVVYRTDKGLRVRAGCFFGDVITFLGLVATTHGNGQHARDYRAAVAFAAGVLGVGENPAKPRRSRKPAAKPTKKKAVKK
jgi:hypothetical protein